MLRKFGIALFVITALFISRASAGTLFFTDQASFAAATVGLQVGPFTGNVLETDVFTTGTTLGPPTFACCTNVSNKKILPPVSVPFKTYSLDLGAFGQAIDAQCFGVPNCTTKALTENIFDFSPTPIRGFSSSLATTGTFGDPPAMINGDIVPINVTNGFFGVLFSNPTTILDFAPSDVLSDDFPNNFVLDINVVFADEPSALGCLLAALLIFSIASVRFGRSQTR
jgi:hypothetical protein